MPTKPNPWGDGVIECTAREKSQYLRRLREGTLRSPDDFRLRSVAEAAQTERRRRERAQQLQANPPKPLRPIARGGSKKRT